MLAIKRLLTIPFWCLLSSIACAGGVTMTPAAGGGGGTVVVQETDGSPTVSNVTGIKVTNGSLTDNGDGTVTINTAGATGVTIGASTVTGGTASDFLYVGAGPVLQQVSISGLVKGNGASAPTAAVAGTDYVGVGGLAGTATALAADPAGCAAGSATTDINASGVSTCANFAEEVGTNGIHVRTAADTWAGRTITGTSNETLITNGDGVAGNPTIGLATTIDASGKSVLIPHSASLPGTCSTGQLYGADSATTGQRLYYCQSANTWVVQGDGGGGGSIGGSTGATDKAVIIANGTGGSTIQASTVTISAGQITAPGGVIAGVSGTGVFTMLEGTAPSAPANAGEHNLYFDSVDSKLKEIKNGGVTQIFIRTSDTIASLNTSTSADLAGVLSDEIGSAGGFVRGTSPTITTPIFSGAITFPANTRQTFTPGATVAGLNVGSVGAAPGSPSNGDIWYDTALGKFQCRQNASTFDCINTAAGSGDVTDVLAGTGIAVASSAGPQPSVSWSPVTQVASFTIFDSANASRTITFGLSGATDPVWTVGDNSMDLTTGVLKQAGVAVTTDASTSTFTNKTLDAEGTGNIVTLPKRYWFAAAGCNGSTAGPIWDLPASSPAVATCVTGTNTQKGVLDFADASNLSAQIHLKLPSTWTGAIDANVKWFSATTSGDVVWQIATICVADAETDDPAFNTADKFTADTAKGTTNQTNDASKTGITTTGCAAGELMHVKLFRDSADAGDTMAGIARLIGVELVVREAI